MQYTNEDEMESNVIALVLSLSSNALCIQFSFDKHVYTMCSGNMEQGALWYCWKQDNFLWWFFSMSLSRLSLTPSMDLVDLLRDA